MIGRAENLGVCPSCIVSTDASLQIIYLILSVVLSSNRPPSLMISTLPLHTCAALALSLAYLLQ